MVAAAGGVAAIVASMRTHATNEDLQANACVALRSLALLEASRAPIVAAGGIDVIVAAMRAHPANASIQESGCSVFDDLSIIEANRPRIANAGGVDAVQAAMCAHSSVKMICSWGKRAVNRCAEHTGTQTMINRAL